MLIDCDSCSVRGAACAGCVVTALVDPPREVAQLAPEEAAAIELFARAGLQAQVLSPPQDAGALRVVPRPRRARRVA